MPSALPEATRASANGSADDRMTAAATTNSATIVHRRARCGIEAMLPAMPTISSSSPSSGACDARHRYATNAASSTKPNHSGIEPISGMRNATTARSARNPMSSREDCSSCSTFVADRGSVPARTYRRATSSEITTTSGQPNPSSSRFDPVMLAAANCSYDGSYPERNA